MADFAMELSDRHLQQITTYLREHITEILPPGLASMNEYVTTQLQVDIARAQEEVRANRDLMDKRFADRTAHTDAQFATVGQRFDDHAKFLSTQLASQTESLNKRFDDHAKHFAAQLASQTESLNKRFEQQGQYLASQLDKQAKSLNARLDDHAKHFAAQLASQTESLNARFADQTAHTDAQFATVGQRFDDMQKSLRSSQWFIGVLVTLVMAASTAVQVML